MCLSSSKISEYDSAMFSTFCNNFSLFDGEKSLMLKIAKLCRFLSWMVINQSMTVLLFKSNKITLLISGGFCGVYRPDALIYLLFICYLFTFKALFLWKTCFLVALILFFYFVASFIVLSINIYIYIYIYIYI